MSGSRLESPAPWSVWGGPPEPSLSVYSPLLMSPMFKVPLVSVGKAPHSLHDRFLLVSVSIAPRSCTTGSEEGAPLLGGDWQQSQGPLTLRLAQLGHRAPGLRAIHITLEESCPKGVPFHIEDGTRPVSEGVGVMEK